MRYHKGSKIPVSRLGFLLSLLLLLHSCKATYRDSFQSVLLDASERDKRVKIETKDSVLLEYKNVIFEEDKFIGISKVKRMKVKTSINLEHISVIKTESKVLMGGLKVALGVIFFIVLLGFIYLDVTVDSDEE